MMVKGLSKVNERKLTDKQKRFIAEYAVDFNQARAIKDAGYKGSTNVLSVISCRLMKDPNVKRAIDAVIAEQQDETRLNRKSVLKKVADNLHRDLYDLCDESGIVHSSLREIPKRAHAFIDGMEVRQGLDEDGNVVSQTIKFKLSPSAAAQDMAMRHIGAYAPDKVDIEAKVASVDITHFFQPPISSEEDLVELAITEMESD